MFNLNFFLLIFILAPPTFANVISTFYNETSDHCIELNRHRVEFSKCCKHPQIHFRKFYDDSCTDECIGSRDLCCSFGCIYRSSNIINDDNEVSAEGLKEVLRKSIHDDENWMEPIQTTVDECMEEFSDVEKSAFCKFPWHITKILGCITRKLFLQCPKLKHVAECKVTRQYAEDCM